MSAAAEIQDAGRAGAEAPPRRPRPEDFDPSPPHAILFWALMFFFFLEFLRPPVLSQLKYQMLFVSLVPILWLTSKDRPWSPILTMQWLMLGQAAISILYGVKLLRRLYGRAHDVAQRGVGTGDLLDLVTRKEFRARDLGLGADHLVSGFLCFLDRRWPWQRRDSRRRERSRDGLHYGRPRSC